MTPLFSRFDLFANRIATTPSLLFRIGRLQPFFLMGMMLAYWGLTIIPADGANSPPILNPIGNRSVEVGNKLSFQVSATDGDGASLTFGTGAMPQTGYYVSPNGIDTNPGTMAAPFLSLERAQAAVRARKAEGMPKGGIVVWIRGGIHERSSEFGMSEADSGTDETHPVVWSGYPGEQARIRGSRGIPYGAWSLVNSSSPVWSRLDSSARGHVIQADLKPILGIAPDSTQAQRDLAYGTLKPIGHSIPVPIAPLELFVDSEPMWIGRWPDRDAHSMPKQDVEQGPVIVFGQSTPAVGGIYRAEINASGQTVFRRDGLVDGLQYYFRATTFIHEGVSTWVWFITTSPVHWANKNEPYWTSYSERPKLFSSGNALSQGRLSALLPERINSGYASTSAPFADNSFTYAGTRPSRWTQAPDAWVEGLWKNFWAQYHLPIGSIDTVSKRIQVEQDLDLLANKPYQIQADQPWIAYNLLEEITQAGEYYLDRQSGILYFWPPAGFGSQSRVSVSMLEQDLWVIRGGRHIVLRDLILEESRKGLLNLLNTQDIVVQGSVLQSSGSGAVSVSGANNLISRCEIRNTGSWAVMLRGGDAAALISGNNRVEDCHIHHFARTNISGGGAVVVMDCGNVVRHNHLHHGPRDAVSIRGPNHLVELNDIHHTSLRSSDSGSIYTPGQWVLRGSMIRNNFIHNVHNDLGNDDVHAIYLDETSAGLTCTGNILYDIAGSAVLIGGGLDNHIRHNIFVNCEAALFADARGLNQAADSTLRFSLIQPRHNALLAVKHWQNPWASAFPACAAIPQDFDILISQAERWLTPRGCRFSGNLCWGLGRTIRGATVVETYFEDFGNNVADADPLFVNEAAMDLRLRPDSPAYLIPGFQDIPFERIGIRN